MKKLLAASLIFASVAFGITSFASAQDTRPAQPAPQTDQGMMGNDMSGMMGRMNKMMDACEKMMQSRDRSERENRR
jgi:hypothetical protein